MMLVIIIVVFNSGTLLRSQNNSLQLCELTIRNFYSGYFHEYGRLSNPENILLMEHRLDSIREMYCTAKCLKHFKLFI